MFPRIKSLKALEEYKLDITFDDGKRVIYDVLEDIEQIEDFKALKSVYKLWEHVNLDQSRTIVFWNDRIDLPSDTLYEYGKEVNE